MTTAEANQLLSDPVRRLRSTGVASDSELESRQQTLLQRREAWQGCIDDHLLEWGRDPSFLEDDGFEPPTGVSVRQAIRVAQEAAANGLPSPLRVLPDGEGGIVFERRQGTTFETISIDADGAVVLAAYRDCKLLGRQQVPV